MIPAAVAQAVLLTGFEKKASCILLSVLFCFIVFCIIRHPSKRISVIEYGWIGIVQFVLCIWFYARGFIAGSAELTENKDVQSLFSELTKRQDIPLLLSALLFGLAGYFFLIGLAGRIDLKADGKTDAGLSPGARILYCFICSAITITICSECSFLYPINSWVDPNAFLTVGKAWTRGLIPYRDLIEQKGPVLYILYGIGSLISADSFFGVYLLEIVSGTCFLYFISKAVALYTGNRAEHLAIPVAAIMTGVSGAFHTGGSTEEFSLALFAYAIYVGLKRIRNHENIRMRQYFIIGISIGCLLWSKYTLLGFYIGWFIFFTVFYCRKKESREIPRMILGFAGGVCAVTLPIVIYFAVKGALADLYTIYFYDNIFLYPGLQNQGFIQGLIRHFLRGATMLLSGNLVAVFLFALGIIATRKSKDSAFLIVSFLFLFFTSFLGEFTWEYYTLPFTVFAVQGIGMLLCETRVNLRRFSCCLAVLPLVCFFMTENRERLGMKREDTPQYAFAVIIRQSEDSTLLNYGFLDGGFYLAADVIPNCRAFCRLAAPIPEMYEGQADALKQGQCEYIVAKEELGSPLYQEVQRMDEYRLYRRKDQGGQSD